MGSQGIEPLCICDAEKQNPECPLKDTPHCRHKAEFEVEVVELEDENGEKEEFAILDELTFEDRNFAILAPLAEIQAMEEGSVDSEEGLSLEIFEVKGELFTPVEDEVFTERLFAHLEALEAAEKKA